MARGLGMLRRGGGLLRAGAAVKRLLAWLPLALAVLVTAWPRRGWLLPAPAPPARDELAESRARAERTRSLAARAVQAYRPVFEGDIHDAAADVSFLLRSLPSVHRRARPARAGLAGADQRLP